MVPRLGGARRGFTVSLYKGALVGDTRLIRHNDRLHTITRP